MSAMSAAVRGVDTPFRCGKLPSVNRSAPIPPQCELRASECMCSAGCQSTFACTPSHFCGRRHTLQQKAAVEPGTAILIFLHFNRSLVRLKHVGKTDMAFTREMHRIEWLLRSVRKVQTRLPVHIVVAGERNASAEANLVRLGATSIIETEAVPPPVWSSLFHKFSFGRIAALSLTRFRKV